MIAAFVLGFLACLVAEALVLVWLLRWAVKVEDVFHE